MMHNQFEFATAGKIIFGTGRLRDIGRHAAECGTRALLVCGFPENALTARLSQLLNASKIETIIFLALSEPSTHLVENGLAALRQNQCDIVISLGGGSAIDTGKAISALATNPGEVLDYLEVVGLGKPLLKLPLPFIAIPTTAGTGSEVTRNAVLEVVDKEVKVSLRSPYMLPRLALVDPELTYGLPPGITASTGLDALTQLIEPFVCNRTNPLTDGVCKEGLALVSRSLKQAYLDGQNPSARQDMSLASLCGGMALANARLGAVHGFAGPLGGLLHAPHGAICASLLPVVIEKNLLALNQREPASEAISRYQQIAEILTGKPGASLMDGIEWVKELVLTLDIPRLSALGLKADQFQAVVEKAGQASSMQGNPIQLTANELHDILVAAF